MNTKRLEELGLTARDTGAGPELDLELGPVPLVNPLTHLSIERVQFTLVGDRLIAIGPPELVGLPPVNLVGIQNLQQLREQVTDGYDAHILHLQRRSAELQALGIPAQVDPETLELSALLDQPPFNFVLLADKQGQFRVSRVFRGGQEQPYPAGQPFELSEFREASALAGYLAALFSQVSGIVATPERIGDPIVHFSEVVERFGPLARLPPRSALEILVEMRVGRTRYRFAAARLAGRSFRGLLAGPSGKMWAERFELEDFPGVEALLAQALGVPLESVEVLAPGTEG